MKVLVTGGSGDIGIEVVRHFREAGNGVTATYNATTPALEDRDGVDWEAVDFSVPDKIATWLEGLEEVDVAVLCAGIAPSSLVGSIPDEVLRASINTNLTVPLQIINRLLPGMLQRGFGRIVLFGSIVARDGAVGLLPYVAAKAALSGAANAVSRELPVLKRRINPNADVTINIVSPGYAKTRMTASVPDSVRQKLEARSATGRFVDVAPLIRVVDFLASPESRDICGANIEVNGGMRT